VRLRLRTAPLVIGLVSAALLAGAPAASAAPKKQTASLGSVKATFTYQQSTPLFRDTKLHLVIKRKGKVAFDGPVKVPKGTGPGSMRRRSVSVRRLDAGEPEVILNLFTGGAHCCTLSAIYRRTSKGYKLGKHDWADSGYRIVNLGGGSRPEFLSADARNFAFRYSSFADSRFPIQIMRYRKGGFRDVTRKFPRRIRKDLAHQKREYKRLQKTYPRGALAAVVADQYLLGRGGEAKKLLKKALKKGVLRKKSSFDVPPYGKAYIRSLLRLLKRTGYRR
jgi:hypothetical protein